MKPFDGTDQVYDGQQLTVTCTLLMEGGYTLDVEVTVEWEDGTQGWTIIECPYEPGDPAYKMIEERVATDIPSPDKIEWE